MLPFEDEALDVTVNVAPSAPAEPDKPTPDTAPLCEVFDCDALGLLRTIAMTASPHRYGEWLYATLTSTAFLQDQYVYLLGRYPTPFDDLRARVLLSRSEERNWGGVEAEYSALHTMACEHICEVDSWYGPPTENATCLDNARRFSAQFTRVALVTDGTCGSACAAFSTAMLFSGDVTVYGYGAEPGAAMDISSFCGGNVEEWDYFWPELTNRLSVTSFLANFSTKALPDFDAASPPLHLPTTAMTRFNFHQLFFRHLGPNALPREWYTLPPHRQLPLWMG